MMLGCKQVALRASALVDGELGAWDALQMRLHLAMCKGCDRFVAQIRSTRDLTSAAALAETAALSEADDRRISALLAQLHDGKHSGAEAP
jgi:anti-sigma factor RsiW